MRGKRRDGDGCGWMRMDADGCGWMDGCWRLEGCLLEGGLLEGGSFLGFLRVVVFLGLEGVFEGVRLSLRLSQRLSRV